MILKQINLSNLTQFDLDGSNDIEIINNLIFISDENGDLMDSENGTYDILFEINSNNEIVPQL